MFHQDEKKVQSTPPKNAEFNFNFIRMGGSHLTHRRMFRNSRSTYQIVASTRTDRHNQFMITKNTLVSSACFALAIMALIFQTGCGTVEKQPEPVVGFSIFPPLQYPGRSGKIDANRTSMVYGDHDSVQGYDLSLFGNRTRKEFSGIATSLAFNWNSGKTNVYILQFAGLVNANTSDANIYGFQIAGLANAGAKTKVYGFQIGLYNEAEAIYGFQIGLINKTKSLHGVQIGLANISSKNGLPFCPLLNIGF